MKLKLDMEEMADDFFEDTRLIGIVAPLKDYVLCWQLNHLFRFEFRNNPDIEIQLTKKQRRYFFSIFEYGEPNTSLRHYLYNNQYDGEYLLPEFKHLDFLWLLKDDWISDDDLQQIIRVVRGISGVQLVIELTHEKIRHKEHLVF